MKAFIGTTDHGRVTGPYKGVVLEQEFFSNEYDSIIEKTEYVERQDVELLCHLPGFDIIISVEYDSYGKPKGQFMVFLHMKNVNGRRVEVLSLCFERRYLAVKPNSGYEAIFSWDEHVSRLLSD